MRNNLQWHSATIRAHRDLSPSVREFEIRPEARRARRGAWAATCSCACRSTAATRARSYSLVGLPDAPGADEVYRIAVRRAEPGRGGSRWLWQREIGDELLIGEPNNHFEIGVKAPHTLLVAGGIGITPILGMALLLARKGASLRMLYAARRADELIYLDALRAPLGERLRTLCSEAGQRIDLDAEIAALPPGGQMALCGPLRLMEAAREAWAARRPADAPTCASRPSATAAGCRPSPSGWSCRATACASRCRPSARCSTCSKSTACRRCRTAGAANAACARWTSSSVQGTVDHRDVFFSAHQKQRNQRLCACVSRVSGGGVVLDSAFRPD